MKNLLSTLAVTFTLMSSLAYAQETGKMEGMGHKMESMGKEHKEQMESMMKEKEECMKESNDNKACHAKVLASCEQKMNKAECDKMMKEMHKKMEKMKKKK